MSSPLSNPSKLAFSCKIWRESVGNYWSKNKQVTCDLNIDKLGARLSFFSIPLIRVDIFFSSEQLVLDRDICTLIQCDYSDFLGG